MAYGIPTVIQGSMGYGAHGIKRLIELHATRQYTDNWYFHTPQSAYYLFGHAQSGTDECVGQ